MSVSLDSAFNYNDLNGLEALKRDARKEDPEALRAVAQQFESMFLSLIMKSMRDATDVLASDLESSYQTRFYRDMYDQQMALSVSQMGGFGLSDILYEQLSQSQPASREAIHRIEVKPLEQSIRARIPLNAGYHSEPAVLANTDSANAPVPVKTLAPVNAQRFESPAQFVETLMPVAAKAAAQIGLDPKVLLAQAALETGWGSAMIQTEHGGSANNFFGIKADHRWQGDSAQTLTTEFFDGKALTVNAPFRVYDSAEASFQDYVDFLSSSSRYQGALSATTDASAYAQALQDAGYATDPDYSEKILRISQSDWFDTV